MGQLVQLENERVQTLQRRFTEESFFLFPWDSGSGWVQEEGGVLGGVARGAGHLMGTRTSAPRAGAADLTQRSARQLRHSRDGVPIPK